MFCRDNEIKLLRQKLTDVSFECHELSAKNETLETCLDESNEKLIQMRAISQAFAQWRIETARKLFIKQYTELILIPHQRKNIQKQCFFKWKMLTYNQIHEKYDLIWQKRIETVSTRIIKEYETTLNVLRKQLKQSQNQCKQLEKERNQMEQDMKRAFMRGVCMFDSVIFSFYFLCSENVEWYIICCYCMLLTDVY